jgi:hypothetical protein
MSRNILPFLNRYAMLGAAFSFLVLALVLIFRSQMPGVAAIIFAAVMVLLAMFLLSVYMRNERDEPGR